MKLFFKISCGSIILICLLYIGIIYCSSQINNLTHQQAVKIVETVKQLHDSTGEYPLDIDQFLFSKELHTQVRYGFIERDIAIIMREGFYIVEYHIFPLGPFEGFSFKDDEWFYSE
jgi:hypothetical protein